MNIFLETWGFLLKCKDDNDSAIRKSDAAYYLLKGETFPLSLIDLRSPGGLGALNFWQKSKTTRTSALFYVMRKSGLLAICNPLIKYK